MPPDMTTQQVTKPLADVTEELANHSDRAREVFSQEPARAIQLDDDTQNHVRLFLIKRTSTVRDRDRAQQEEGDYQGWRLKVSALEKSLDVAGQRFEEEIRKQIPDFCIDRAPSSDWNRLNFAFKTAEPLEASHGYALVLELTTGYVNLHSDVPRHRDTGKLAGAGYYLDDLDDRALEQMLQTAFRWFVSHILGWSCL